MAVSFDSSRLEGERGQLSTFLLNLFFCQLICKIINFDCKLVFDTKKPDGTKSKVLNIKKILSLNWKPQINLNNGIAEIIKSNKFLAKWNQQRIK